MKFTIIIPTYNREKYILNTLESVFAQKYRSFEVIVIDNCSTDKTAEILQPLIKAGKIHLIKQPKNYERAFSRNTGMENAGGDFLTFLDSDDFMYPENLADAAEFAERNPAIKCFHNLYELIDSDRKIVRKYNFSPIKNRIKDISNGNFMSCVGNFIHREIYTKYRFDTYQNLIGAEDWDFWIRIIGDYEVGRINKINSGILHHDFRTINSFKHYENLENGYQHMFQKILSDRHLYKIYAKYLSRIKANSYMYLAILANSNGIFKDARKYLQIAASSDPNVIISSRFLKILGRTLMTKQIK